MGKFRWCIFGTLIKIKEWKLGKKSCTYPKLLQLPYLVYTTYRFPGWIHKWQQNLFFFSVACVRSHVSAIF